LPSTPSSPAEPSPRHRGWLALVALGIVALVVGITAWVIAGDGTPSTSTSAGTHCAVKVSGPSAAGRAPRFEAPGLRGGCVDFARYRGRPLVVNFWASYCNPCRREFPLFRRALRAHRDDGLQIIGVSHDDIDDDARAFAEQFGATWPLALDPDGTVADAYGLRPPGLPHSFFVRRDGTVSAHVFGETSPRELDAEIDEIARR
jgi:peroxiredoxin